MDWRERIVTDANILSGQPTVRGARLAVAFILDRLAEDHGGAGILADYPQLSEEDIQACLRYASERVAPQKVSPISGGLATAKAIPQEARAMLTKADERFRHYDYGEGSRLIWQTVEWAIRDVAAKRGWPCGNERDLELAVERLGEETGDDDEKLTMIGGLQNAQVLLDNARNDGHSLSPDRTAFYASLAPPFIELIFAAGPPD